MSENKTAAPLNMQPGVPQTPPLEIFTAYRKAVVEKREEMDTILGMRQETLILNCIRNGSTQELRKQIAILDTYKLGLLSKDKLRQVRYLFVVAITLVTRESIKGGLAEVEAYSLSDVYIQYMDKIDNINDIIALLKTAIFDFTEKVSRTSTAHYSPVIKKCNNYIVNNLNNKITIEMLSAECGYSKAYISGLFKKELGMTVMEFILGKRMDIAKELLSTTDASVQTIALFLGFSSNSHFTSVFSKETGMTPKQYRKMVK